MILLTKTPVMPGNKVNPKNRDNHKNRMKTPTFCTNESGYPNKNVKTPNMRHMGSTTGERGPPMYLVRMLPITTPREGAVKLTAPNAN